MTQTIKQLAFMTEAVDGKYDAPKPTDEQLAAVLPWIVNEITTWAKRHGHCETVDGALYHLATHGKPWKGGLRFYNKDGYDCYGYNKDGYNVDGYNQNGYNVDGFSKWGYDRYGYDKDGFNENGRDKDGFNKDGLNRYDKTRVEVAAKMATDWTPEYLALVAAKLAERQATEEAEVAAKLAAEQAAAAEAVDATNAPATEELVTAAAA
jgi:hypothetical protein